MSFNGGALVESPPSKVPEWISSNAGFAFFEGLPSKSLHENKKQNSLLI